MGTIVATEPRKAKHTKIQAFFSRFEGIVTAYDCWRGASYNEVDDASESLEHLITIKKHRELFATDADILDRDRRLTEAYQAYSFVEPRHLEINPSFATQPSIAVAIDILKQINNFRTPRDKLTIIANSFRAVNTIIKLANQGKMHGADESLPLFVYVVLKSRVESLFSNYYFIKTCRFYDRFERRDPVEFRYILTSFKIALKFVIELNPDRLVFEPGEDANSKSEVKVKGVSRSVQTSPVPPGDEEMEMHPFHS
mmetsp:Transcript_19811/g.36579  ORF Transcript_19811/g.36579 Transcript_19811/m.36579 type:complete len:255 (+) Transcript_19811:3551-4315(+)|eukprot:CAMPEP_0204919602 /NCGR_PEP_ID=MMETSP1397-20131031/16907_1 /ASSEMBLY_ACC=CAM_ASM_000891 /TAXON_ID=49980 /ORGANISM="Climacostomum Climacostomum virens, Strain Stock W-24" /LENGTH=254 /DNA_ID=CAMNT_0052093209 /DNA_START=3672 /DNA_END=4436 /DNA_ORIENTATION=+